MAALELNEVSVDAVQCGWTGPEVRAGLERLTLMNRDRVKVTPVILCEGLIHRATWGKL